MSFELSSFTQIKFLENTLSTKKKITVKRFSTKNRHNAFPSVALLNDQIYIAYRSATVHGATINSKIILAKEASNTSSARENKKWEVIKTISVKGYDVRDPRIVAFNNKIYIYFSTLKPNVLAFNPVQIKLCVYDPKNYKRTNDLKDYSETVDVYKRGFVAYNVKSINNKLYMCAYEWTTDDIFENNARILESEDGIIWDEITDFGEFLIEGTESDFIITNDSKLIWVVRQDFCYKNIPETLLHIKDLNTGEVTEKNIMTRLDAPILFSLENNFFMLSRSHSGEYYKHFKLTSPLASEKKMYELVLNEHSNAKKHIGYKLNMIVSFIRHSLGIKYTALNEIDLETISVKQKLILPTTGDTGYCTVPIVTNADSKFVNMEPPITNINVRTFVYTSDTKKMSWLTGMLGKTSIYECNLNYEASQ